MARRKKPPKTLHRERKKTDRSLKSERTATDQSLSRQSASTQRSADAARRQIRSEADRGLAGQRKSADAERSRRTSTKPASHEVQRLRSKTEEKLFDRERKRADQNRGEERGRTDAMFLDAENRLRRAKTATEKAAAAVVLRDEFMAIVSHDLRTPLNVIAINAARLAKMVPAGEGSEQIRKMCLQIEDAVGRIGRMANDLLEAERMALARIELLAQPGDLRDLAREAIELVAPIVSARGISFAAAVPEDSLVARFDRDRMLQVFANLLTNAVKFTPIGGMVQLAMEADDGRIRVTVSDTGSGIPSDQHKRIFRRFTQIGRSRGGVGLGLYIARRIVEAHQGKIGLISRPGEGSTFFFTLPRIQKPIGKEGNP